MFEELFNPDEEPQPTEHPLINRAAGNREPLKSWESFLYEVEILVHKRGISDLLGKLKEAVHSCNIIQWNKNPLTTNLFESSPDQH